MAVMVAVEPATTLEFEQEMGAKFGQSHVPPPVVVTATETNVVFAGVASEKVPLLQLAGPWFVMVCVKVILEPAVTGFGVPLLVTVRSQATFTGVTTLVLLFDDCGSEVVAETEDAAVIELAVTVAGTLTTTIMFADAPDARLGFVQVIVPVAPIAGVVHVHPAGAEIDWNVVFVGVA